MDAPTTGHRPGQGGWFALVLARAAWPATSSAVRADRATSDGATLTLWDGERPVHRVPLALVVAAEAHPTQRAATRALATRREAGVGGATVHVAEAASAPAARGARGARGGGTAIPAEGIRVVIDEG